MREFTATELGKDTKGIMEAARAGVVAITRHGKPRFVMMSIAAYETLLAGGDPVDQPEPEPELWGDLEDLFEDG